MKQEFPLAWGDPVVIRQALVETLGRKVSLEQHPFEEMAYTPHLGSPKLIEQLKNLSKRQSGFRPKHLFVTIGATGGINASLYALKNLKTEYVLTNPRYFPIYPGIITASGLVQIDNFCVQKKDLGRQTYITLIDSPSNPEGLVFPFKTADIWDSAYASRCYGGYTSNNSPAEYKIMCGSLSKTLGLSGLRLGWVCTNDDQLAESLGFWITANYIGLSNVSMALAEEVLSTLDMDSFEIKAANYLDSNREEMQKLFNKFGAGDVPSRGMFAILEMGKTEKKALKKAGIIYQSGETWGENEDWARLSLGQSREITKAAVKKILE